MFPALTESVAAHKSIAKIEFRFEFRSDSVTSDMLIENYANGITNWNREQKQFDSSHC